MTIQVVSSDAPAAKEPTEPKEVNESAPEEQKSSEQNESSESETEETEEQKAKDESTESEESKEESTEAKDTDKEKPKKKGGFQRRIDKLNASKTEALREAEYWKKLALEQQSAGERNSDKKVEPKVDSTGKPNPDSFETHSEYIEALTDWKVEQKSKALEEKSRKAEIQSEQDRLIQAHSDRVKTFAEKTDDFDDVLESVDDIRISPAVQEIIVSSDNGPELMYELAKNREEYARICKLSPLAAAREIGRIESKIATKSSELEKPKPKLTNAPKPITPVGSKGGTVEKSIYDPSLSQKDYERLRAKQEREAQRY